MNWRMIAKKLLFPPPVIVALLAMTAAVGLSYGFIALDETDGHRIIFYVLSFYALMILSLRVPEIIAFFQRFRRENRYYLRYASDVRLRMNISLAGSFIYNAGYGIFQLALGVYHRSAWFYAMAGYYCLLALIRMMLGRHIRSFVPGEERMSEWRKYRLCGAGLLLMNLALSVFTIYFVRNIRIVHHHEITVIAMATYTFGALTLAIVNIVRYRRYESPVCSAAKMLSLAAACVSMLSLENVMLTTFSETDSMIFRKIMLGATGAVTALFIVTMAFYMIVRATRNLKSIHDEQE